MLKPIKRWIFFKYLLEVIHNSNWVDFWINWYFETGQLRNMKTNKWRKNLSGRRIEMGLCFAKRSLEGWGSEEKKFFLATLFLLKQKAGVMKESPLSLVSRTKNVFSWRKTHSSEGNQTQWTFLKDTSLLLKEKQSCQKNFFSEIHHPSNDLEAKQNTSLNSPETQIFEAFVCFYIANLPCFSIFCYLTKLIFFPFCWILNAGNGVFNRWFNWFSNLHVKKC